MTINNPSISVVIPTCDRPLPFLVDAIRSVLAQSVPPLEVLVVDNGTHAVDPESLPKGVSVYRIGARVGPSRARNFGGAMAKGEYLAFLDDDDWWGRDFLRECWLAMQRRGAICVYGRKDMHRDGRIVRHKIPDIDKITVATLLQSNPCTGGQNLLIEKRFYFAIGGFDERLHTAEDRALALEVLLAGEKIAAASEAVVIVRHHGGSRQRQLILRRLRFLWKYRRLRPSISLAAEALRIVLLAILTPIRKRTIFR